MKNLQIKEEELTAEHVTPKIKVGIIGHGGIAKRTREILEHLNKENVEVVEMDEFKAKGLTDGSVIFSNDDLIREQSLMNQEPYLIRNIRENDLYIPNYKEKRTDGERLRDHGIDTLDKLLEECIKVSNKQSKLPKSIRDLVLKYSLEAYKELQSKAKEIEKESLENNKQENDRKE